jgi:DNA mismatch repair protein MutS2
MDIEYKLSFNEIRTQIKGRCISTLGTEWVDNHVQFTSDVISIRESLCLVNEFNEFLDNELDVYEDNFFDVRQALVKLRPEKTYLEEIDLYNLKRSLSTINDLIRFFLNIDDDEKKRKYATLIKLSETTPNFPSLINKIDDVLNKYGKVKDTASKEL